MALCAVPSGCALPGGPPAAATPQRPGLSSDANTTAPGTFELELGFGYDSDDANAAPLTLKYGAGAATEVFASFAPYARAPRPGTDGRGLSDLLLGTRHRFWTSDAGDRMAAWQATVLAPTGESSAGLSGDEWDFAGAAMLTGSEDGWWWNGFYQLGQLGDPDGGGFDTQHALALVAGLPVADGVDVFTELAGVWTPARGHDPTVNTWAVTWREQPWRVWDAGFALGLDDDAPDRAVFVGLTVNLGGNRKTR